MNFYAPYPRPAPPLLLDVDSIIVALDKLAYLEEHTPRSKELQQFEKDLRVQIARSVLELKQTVRGATKWAFYTGHVNFEKAVIIDDLPEILIEDTDS